MINLLGYRLEDSESLLFTDAFKIKALNNGIVKLVQAIDNKYLTELQVLKSNLALTTGYAALSSANLGYLSLRGGQGILKVRDYTTGKYCLQLGLDEIKKVENTYLAPSADNPVFYIFQNKLYVLPATITAVDVFFIKIPTELIYKFLGTVTGGYFEDDFESGDFAKWDEIGSDWSVQDAIVKSGDYTALCDVTAWESEEAKLEKAGTWQNFTVEGDIRVNQKYGVCQKATIGGRSNGTGWLYYGLSMRPGDGGHFQYYDGTDFHNFPNDKTWNIDTWYHFKIIYDFDNSIQYTYVDDYYLGERSMKDGHGVLLDGNRYFEKVSIFGSSGWESGHDYLYIDNVVITPTETATLTAAANQGLVETNDYYNNFALYSVYDNAYSVVTNYVGATRVFTVSPPLTNQTSKYFYLMRNDFDELMPQDTKGSLNVAPEINPAIHEIAVSFAESYCWAMDNKVDRSKIAYDQAMSEIALLNSRYSEPEGIGTSSRKRS